MTDLTVNSELDRIYCRSVDDDLEELDDEVSGEEQVDEEDEEEDVIDEADENE